jgi:hypothetical protein
LAIAILNYCTILIKFLTNAEKMKQPKLYLHLQTLNKKALKRFADFVESPYFSRHEETKTFFKALCRFHPDYKISDEKLFAKAFPDRAYDYARLRILRTYLLDMLHRFWTLEEMEKDEEQKIRLKIRALDQQGLGPDQRKEIEKAKAPLEKMPLSSLSTAYHAYSLAESWVDSNLKMNTRTDNNDIQLALRRLDEYAICNRLKILCAVLNNRANITQEETDYGIRETLDLTERMQLHRQPLLGLYYHLLHLLSDADHEVHFPIMRGLLRENQAHIESSELVNIFGFLINYCLYAYNRGRPEFLRIAFEVYQEMIALDLLFGQGGFSAHNYKNILALGARLKEFDWTRTFLEETYLQLPERYREGVFHYGHAYLDFAQGSYKEAKKHLLQVEFYDQLYRSSHQVLLLRIYYETEEVEPFFALVETFRRYLNRNNDLSEGMIDALQNQISLTKKAFELKIGELKLTLKELREEVLSIQPMVDRSWILEKLDEM